MIISKCTGWFPPITAGRNQDPRSCRITTTNPGGSTNASRTYRTKAAGEDTTIALLRRSRCLHVGQNSTTSPSLIRNGYKTKKKRERDSFCTHRSLSHHYGLDFIVLTSAIEPLNSHMMNDSYSLEHNGIFFFFYEPLN